MNATANTSVVAGMLSVMVQLNVISKSKIVAIPPFFMIVNTMNMNNTKRQRHIQVSRKHLKWRALQQ